MKVYTLWHILCAGLCLLLCGCSTARTPSSAGSTQGGTGGEPLDMTVFSFHHTASRADECFHFEVKREGDEIHLSAEELFFNGRIVDAVVEEELLERLEELGGKYGIDRWDGFDQSKKRVSDGSTFTLSLILAERCSNAVVSGVIAGKPAIRAVVSIVSFWLRSAFLDVQPASNKVNSRTANVAFLICCTIVVFMLFEFFVQYLALVSCLAGLFPIFDSFGYVAAFCKNVADVVKYNIAHFLIE